MDDSIPSSPSKSNKTIRETRLKRKNKRKNTENSEQIKNDHKPNYVDFDKIIHDFYYQDSDNDSLVNDNSTTFSITKTPAIVSNYKPFELEKSLAIADRLPIKQINCNKSNLVPQEKQGFITCMNLKEMELDNETPGHISITETQILNCCDQAEQNLQLTPKKDELFLVNSILEDFSQSPLNKEQIKIYNAWQYTPEFKLRQKPLKTYSRKFLNKTKTNLNERFAVENVNNSDDDDDVDERSSNSSLSIQEDATVGEFTNNQTTVTNIDNSRLCENLLNLSVYFTQNNQSQESSSNDEEYQQENLIFSSNASYLIKDILTLRSMYQKSIFYGSYNSIENFLGFPELKEDNNNNAIDVDNAEHNSLHTTLNVEHDLNINNDRLLETSLNEQADWNDDNCQDIFACINTEQILEQQNIKKSIAIENDNECIETANLFNNEKPKISENSTENEMPNEMIGFRTASAKPIQVSKEAQIMAAKILSKLPDIPQKQSTTIENNNEFVESAKVINNDKSKISENAFQTEISNNIGFTTASAKPIKVSREAQIMAAKILSKLPDIPQKQSTTIENNNEFVESAKVINNNKPKISENSIENKMPNKMIGFRTASAKPIQVSKEAQIMAAKILSKLPDIPQKQSTTIENNNEFAESAKVINNDKSKISENAFQTEISNKNIGFTTASAKPIQISREAQIMAAKILSKLPDIPGIENNCDNTNLNDVDIFKNLEIDEWNDDCDLLLNIQTPIISNEKPKTNLKTPQQTLEHQLELEGPTTSKMATLGFKTAGGKNVNISRKAQESVQKLLKQFNSDPIDNYNYEEELKEIKTKVFAKTHNVEIKSTNNIGSEEQVINTNISFKTAKSKNIQISEKAQHNVNNLLSDFYMENKELEIESNLEIMKQNIYRKNKETKQKSNECITEDNKPKMSITNIDCQTAKDNKIITCSKAQESVEILLKEFRNENNTDFINDLKSVKNVINNKNNKEKEKIQENYENEQDLSGIMLSEWPLEKSMELQENVKNNITKTNTKEEQTEDLKSNINKGFQTANGKQVVISHNGQQMVEKLLQEFNTIEDIDKYENDLKTMKTKLQIKNKELKVQHNISSTTKSSQGNKEFTLSPRNSTPQSVKRKRQYSIDNSEISPRINSSPPAKISKDISNSKSSLAEQSLKSPLTLASYSVIGRKNLLSLTRRRKNKRERNDEIPKINKEIYNLNQDALTPIKSSTTPLRVPQQTPATPNLKEFFSEAPLTSTPLINHKSSSSKIIKDTDFKPINWKNNESTNTSINHTTKLSESSSMNVSLNSSNPTTKERIGRLKMYGKAPAVSPILIGTHNNYRPSGLRRTRSMLKKTE